MLDLQKKIKTYLKKRNWHNNPPADIAKSISIEAAELLEYFQWSNPGVKQLKSNKEKYADMQEEVADIFIYITGMAIACGFDLEKVVEKKMAKVELKYPAKLIKNKSRDEYLKLKTAYRNAHKK